MSLESRLHDMADAEFRTKFVDMFNEFECRFLQLTGLSLQGGRDIPEACQEFRAAWGNARYFDSTSKARAFYTSMRDLYRDQYVARFIQKVEELEAFTGEQP